MDLYAMHVAGKAKRRKKRDQDHLAKFDSIPYLRRLVQKEDGPTLEHRLRGIEGRRRSGEGVTKSHAIFYSLEKQRLATERARRETAELMYAVLPGDRSEIKRLAPQTFQYDGVTYRIKRHFEQFRVYAQRVGSTEKSVVKGDTTDLESVITQLRGVHQRLSYKPRVALPAEERTRWSAGFYSLRTEDKNRSDRGQEKVVDLGDLVPVFGYLSPGVEALGVRPMVVGFQRVDGYGNPVSVEIPLPEDAYQEETTATSPHRKSRLGRYARVAAVLALVVADTNSQQKLPGEIPLPVHSSLPKKIENPRTTASDPTYHQFEEIPGLLDSEGASYFMTLEEEPQTFITNNPGGEEYKIKSLLKH